MENLSILYEKGGRNENMVKNLTKSNKVLELSNKIG